MADSWWRITALLTCHHHCPGMGPALTGESAAAGLGLALCPAVSLSPLCQEGGLGPLPQLSEAPKFGSVALYLSLSIRPGLCCWPQDWGWAV